MKLTIAIILSLILTFGLHWVTAKISRVTLKEFYKYYSQDQYTTSYLALITVVGFITFLTFILSIF
jgi:hypothetical protein